MWPCFRNCFVDRIGSVLLAAAVFAVIAAAAAAFGGLTIVAAGVTLGVVTSAILAALLVFGIVVAMIALVCLIGCLLKARPEDNQGGVVPNDPPRPPPELPTTREVPRTGSGSDNRDS